METGGLELGEGGSEPDIFKIPSNQAILWFCEPEAVIQGQLCDGEKFEGRAEKKFGASCSEISYCRETKLSAEQQGNCAQIIQWSSGTWVKEMIQETKGIEVIAELIGLKRV